MKFEVTGAGERRLAELVSDEVCLKSPGDALDILAAAGANMIILHVRQIAPDFFRLPTGLLGEVLQKFTNYRVRCAFVGDISPWLTKNFSDFVRESNRSGDFIFVATRGEAVKRFTAGG
jgi:hypothetical protein